MPDGASATFSLVTFATGSFASAQQRLVDSARSLAGFRKSIAWDADRLRDAGFGADMPDLLSKRGAGYWMWKPFIVLAALEDTTLDSDWVLYYDVGAGKGNRITREMDPLANWADRVNGGLMPGVLIPEFGPTAWWTRRDTFIGMDCDGPRYHQLPQVQATFCLFRRGERSRAFVQRWWEAARQIALIGEGEDAPNAPNLPGFLGHRHDQSILTLLCAREGVVPFGSTSRRVEMSKSLDSVIAEAAGERRHRLAPALRRTLSLALRRVPITGAVYRAHKPFSPMMAELARRGYHP